MSTELSELLFNALNEQGYLFQEACEYALKKNEEVTKWEVKASEYPVSLEGQDTKIDIVLHSKTPNSPELYAVVECKRSDPSYSYWLFGAPGLPFGGALGSTLGFECCVTGTNYPYKANRIVEQLHFEVNTYGAESWIEVKKNTTRRTSTPQNIENAFVQVLKGVGGLAREQISQRNKSRELFKTFFVPVVVTTAQLYVAYYETKNIDLSTGKLGKDKVFFGPREEPAQEVEWVLVDYGVGENVAPNPIPENYQGVDPIELQKYKIRSIFIVNSKSLVLFFSKLRLIQ